MTKDLKSPEALEDEALDDAQGGYSIELTNATVSSIKTEQLPRSGIADYDESGPGIVHSTAGAGVVDTGVDQDHRGIRQDPTRRK